MSDKQNTSISAKELESIEKKKLSELQVIAKSIGVNRVTGVRKNDLIDQIREKTDLNMPSSSPTGDEPKKERRTKKPRKKAQKVNIEELVEENDKTSQKEDELTTYGGSSHIISYKKEEPTEKKEHKNGKDLRQRSNKNQNHRKRNHEHDQLPVS